MNLILLLLLVIVLFCLNNRGNSATQEDSLVLIRPALPRL